MNEKHFTLSLIYIIPMKNTESHNNNLTERDYWILSVNQITNLTRTAVFIQGVVENHVDEPLP